MMRIRAYSGPRARRPEDVPGPTRGKMSIFGQMKEGATLREGQR